jgi:hypothetical protein
VIQCLISSAVTSLGSPARHLTAWLSGRSQPWTSETKVGARREHFRRAFFWSHFGARNARTRNLLIEILWCAIAHHSCAMPRNDRLSAATRSDGIAAEALDGGNGGDRHAGRPGQHRTAGFDAQQNRKQAGQETFGMAPRAASESNSGRHSNRQAAADMAFRDRRLDAADIGRAAWCRRGVRQYARRH